MVASLTVAIDRVMMGTDRMVGREAAAKSRDADERRVAMAGDDLRPLMELEVVIAAVAAASVVVVVFSLWFWLRWLRENNENISLFLSTQYKIANYLGR